VKDVVPRGTVPDTVPPLIDSHAGAPTSDQDALPLAVNVYW
jgi:hypothetical protein